MPSSLAIWCHIAVVLNVINLIAVGFAAGSAEPWHAAGHTALALPSGYGPSACAWPRRERALGSARGARSRGGPPGGVSEMQERLDAERLLAQRPEARGVGPEH